MANTNDETSLEAIKKDVANLTQDQMVLELVKWRQAIPNIAKMSREIAQFRQFGSTPEALAAKINHLSDTYKAEIERRDIQLQQLSEVLAKYAEDPIGVGHHLEEMTANSGGKLH